MAEVDANASFTGAGREGREEKGKSEEEKKRMKEGRYHLDEKMDS